MRNLLIALPLSLALTAAAACDSDSKPAENKTAKADKKADAKGDEKAPADEEAAPAKPAGPNLLQLEKLGLKAEVPEGATAGDAIIGEGVMIQGPGIVVTVEEASDSRPKTADDAKEDAEMYTPQNLKAEELADGWAVTFDNSGSMGANYFVQVRRDIGGKTYWCETTASQPEQQENALKACKSLQA
ncbi:MAG: hypothetical protein H6713_01745 [Myxococcales bacterium]|nr:hypothetical protein [Myxococcales bacterium]